jgi:hypothetical protein
MLGATAKPSFALVFLFGAPLYLILTHGLSFAKWRERWLDLVPIVAVALILAAQYYIQYQSSLAQKVQPTSIAFGFWVAAKAYSPNPVVSLLLVAAFPIATIALFPSALGKRQVLFCAVLFLVATLQYWFLYETGQRLTHGNFHWGLHVANPLLFTVCAAEVINRMRVAQGAFDFARLGTLTALFIAHVVSGIQYIAQLLLTPSFW